MCSLAAYTNALPYDTYFWRRVDGQRLNSLHMLGGFPLRALRQARWQHRCLAPAPPHPCPGGAGPRCARHRGVSMGGWERGCCETPNLFQRQRPRSYIVLLHLHTYSSITEFGNKYDCKLRLYNCLRLYGLNLDSTTVQA